MSQDLKSLANEKNRYLAAFESIPTPVILLNETGSTEDMNHAAVTLFRREVAGGTAHFGETNSKGVPPWLKDEISSFGTDGNLEYTFEKILETRKGSQYFQIKLKRLLDVSEKPKGIVVILTDLTDWRSAEHALTCSRAEKAAILEGLRNVTDSVLSMTEVIVGTDLCDEQRENMELVKQSAQSHLDRLNSILDISKIEAGKMELEPDEFNLRDFVNTLVSSFMVPADNGGLGLYCRIDPSLPSHIIADRGKLRQVLLNLLDNALKFTEQGEVVLRIERAGVHTDLRCRDGANSLSMTLHVSVSDTGIGIRQDKLNSVFDAFAQADDSTTSRLGGTGLGLAISKGLVEFMEGRIWVESKEGIGSAFHFTTAVTCRPETAYPSNQKIGEKAPILLVAASTTNRAIIREMLQSWGFSVTEVEDQKTALARMYSVYTMKKPFRLLVIDPAGTDADAIEFVRTVRLSPALALSDIILLVSAKDESAVRFGGLSTSCRVVRKPVAESRLLDAIMTALGHEAPVTVASRKRRGIGETTLPLHILVAEDNPVSQKVASHLLHERGHTVCCVEDGGQAIEALKREQFDLVLMDVQMSVMDGIEATRQIRLGRAGENNSIPIIALTAHVKKGDKERFLAAGMDDFVAKPIDVKEFFKIIESAYITGREVETRPQAGTKAVVDPVVAAERTDGDEETFRLRAHPLTTGCANTEAVLMSASAYDLEQAGPAGRLDGLAKVHKQLKQEWRKVKRTLARYCSDIQRNR